MEVRRGEYDGAYGRAAEEWLLKKKAEFDRLEAARCGSDFMDLRLRGANSEGRL